MRYRKLGDTSLTVSELGLGLGGSFATLSRGWAPRRMERLIRTAIDLGINYFDTADAYGGGASELVLGRVLASRDVATDIVVATKGGHVFSAANQRALLKRVLYTFGIRPKRKRIAAASRPRSDYSPDYLRSAVHASLKRLKVDCIDLYQLHSPTSITEATLDAMLQMRAEGLIRHWGASLYKPDDVLGLRDCEAVQIRYGAGNFESAGPILRLLTCGIIARQPFTGYNGSPTEALRFAVRSGVHTVVFGTTSAEHLRANVRAVDR